MNLIIWQPSLLRGKVAGLRAEGDLPFGGSLRVKIRKVFEPSTLPCVMEVDVAGIKGGPTQVVLKLHDRRFAKQLRDDQKNRTMDENARDGLHRLRQQRWRRRILR
jgi:hypothetical protein